MTSLAMAAELYNGLIRHLSSRDVEHAAFLFAEPATARKSLRARDLYVVPPEGFDFQSDYHIELTDEVRAYVIKRAWDTGTCLVEAHSHVGQGAAAFSQSDLYGFREWVPHVRWRLERRAYVALVFTNRSFDGLVWDDDSAVPHPLDSLDVDGAETRTPSSLTYRLVSRKGK